MLVTENEAFLGNEAVQEAAEDGRTTFKPIRMWTDQYSNLFQIFDDQEDEDELEGESTDNDRVDICHYKKKKGGKKKKKDGKNKSIKKKDLAKHLGHGDYLGTCIGWVPDR